MAAHLIARLGLEPHQVFPLTEAITNVGRAPGNEIVLTDSEISRRHARIIYEDDRYLVEDLGSTNGTFLNGRRLSRATPLQNQDVIDFGESFSFTFQKGGPEASDPLDFDTPSVTLQVPPDPGEASPHPYRERETYVDEGAVPPRGRPLTPPAEAPAPGLQGPLGPAIAAESDDIYDSFAEPLPEPGQGSIRRWLLGCSCSALALLFLCTALVFFLDSYQQGRLLYCGVLRPVFELLLGPFGFAPVCP